MTDTQDKRPDVEESLERVGITNLRTIVQTKWRGHNYRFVPKIEITIDLEKSQKGAHMSRLVETITEMIEKETRESHESLEELEKHILERLSEKHRYRRAEVKMETELVVQEETPVTKKKTMETHDIAVSVVNDNGNFRKMLEVRVIGNTVCPHSMEKTGGRAHMQRAVGVLGIETEFDNKIALEDMIAVVERSFSSTVYTLLKTEDEKSVVKKMVSNPKFVEDVCREMLGNAKRFEKSKIRAKVVSQESIHRHDVIAEGSIRT